MSINCSVNSSLRQPLGKRFPKPEKQPMIRYMSLIQLLRVGMVQKPQRKQSFDLEVARVQSQPSEYDNMTPQAAAVYIRAMAIPLRQTAVKSHLSVLAYLLDMVCEEAADRSRDEMPS